MRDWLEKKKKKKKIKKKKKKKKKKKTRKERGEGAGENRAQKGVTNRGTDRWTESEMSSAVELNDVFKFGRDRSVRPSVRPSVQPSSGR